MSRLVWLATFAIGCGHPSTPVTPGQGSGTPVAHPDAAVDAPVGLEQDLPKLAERAVKLYADWKVAFDEAGTDCAAATAKMNAIADANADVIEANQHLYHGPRERVRLLRAELDKHKDELDASAKAIMQSPTLATCSTNAAFGKAFDRLGGE